MKNLLKLDREVADLAGDLHGAQCGCESQWCPMLVAAVEFARICIYTKRVRGDD